MIVNYFVIQISVHPLPPSSFKKILLSFYEYTFFYKTQSIFQHEHLKHKKISENE